MKHRESIQTQIIAAIETKSDGEILFPGDFLEFGSPEAIHMALSRLTDQDSLIRLGKGIYVKPKIDPLLGSLRPSLEEIAQAIASKEKVIIRPTGSYALNKLGLSTQVPTKVVYLTNGSPRTIHIGKGTITFKSTTPKKLAAQNETVFLVTQALETLGPDGTTDKIMSSIAKILKQTSPLSIREDAQFASHRIARILYNLADQLEKND